ncbi:MAG: SEL1-like repeat protein [Proteobacteria bacterium]|nr:SEL1-like repeat protein [Pseudomonadota bacterium]
MKRIALAVVLVVSLATPAWAGYEEGVAAYGRGDFPAALREFEDLALQGDAAAQFYLGIMYDRGGGVAQDDGEAVKWHRLAAAQGSAKALNNIGLLYQNGFDVPRDLAKAYAWYSLAADSFGPGRQREQAARKRDGVAKEISPQQLGRARRLARAWSPGTAAIAAASTPTRAFVALVQDKLQRSGHDPGPVDGLMGFATRAAIRAFQAARQIPITGEISEELLRELDTASLERTARPPTPEPSVPAAPTGALVVRVQEKLARSGHDPGPADGIVGPKTRAAIRAFQAAKNIPVTGEVSAELLRELEITPAD